MSTEPLSATKPLYIVLNSASGAGAVRTARDLMSQILVTAGREHEFLVVRHPEQLPQIAQWAVRHAAQRGAAIVAAGGDGTINALAQAALPAGLPFGIVPQGSFNYSSRAHGVPSDAAEATRALLRARIKPVQAGVVNRRIFLVNATLGLYPQIIQDREYFMRRYGRRRVVAAWSALLTLARGYRQLLLELEYDGRLEIVLTPTLFVGNNPLQLEQVGLPEADVVEHGRLAAVIVRPIGPAKLAWLGIRGALGQLGDAANVRDFSFRTMIVRPVRARSAQRIRVSIDGEITHLRAPLEFSVASRPLLLMTPS